MTFFFPLHIARRSTRGFGKNPQFPQQPTGFQHVRIVHVESVDGGSAARCLSLNLKWMLYGPLKVIRPPIESRVEQQNPITRLWIDTIGVCPFVSVAVRTGQRQVFQVRLSAAAAGKYVVNGKSRHLPLLREATVLASMVSSRFHCRTHLLRNDTQGEFTNSGQTSSRRFRANSASSFSIVRCCAN